MDPKLLEKVEESPDDRIWCQGCGTDEFLLVERARWRRRHGEGLWDIDYFCTKCDSFYGHVVRDAEVTPTLMAAMSAIQN
ncbi:hypothetical protein B5P43_12760 [Bacillus sp. SRB_336]|nr:hypothetical protein B5P43_12760 [Bacillus sp. SRB_336]